MARFKSAACLALMLLASFAHVVTGADGLPLLFSHDFRQPVDLRNRAELSTSVLALSSPSFGQGCFLCAGALIFANAKSLEDSFPSEIKLFNVQRPNHLQFQPDGLLIKVPGTFKIPKGDGVGLVTRFGLKGDFDITVAFDDFQDQIPASGPGVGLGLYMHASNGPNVMISRIVKAANNQVLRLSWWHDKRNDESFVPCADARGRMRFARSGAVLRYLWSPALQGDDFKTVFECAFGNRDIEFVRLNAYTGGMPCDLQVRILDWRIYGRIEADPEAIPPANTASAPKNESAKGGVALALIIGLILTLSLALGIWLFVRRRRQAGEPAKNVPTGK